MEQLRAGSAGRVPGMMPPAWFATEPSWRFSVLLAALALFVFVAVPLLSEREVPHVVPQSLILLVSAGTIALITNRLSVRLIMLGSFLISAAAYLLPGYFPVALATSLTAAYALLITLLLARAVLARGVVDLHRVAGAVALYLNTGVMFAALYVLVSAASSNAFSGLSPDREGRVDDMIHFSLTTLTTLGYGDILPRNAVARSLADLEGLIGQLFPATLLAGLVSLEINSRAAREENPKRKHSDRT